MRQGLNRFRIYMIPVKVLANITSSIQLASSSLSIRFLLRVYVILLLADLKEIVPEFFAFQF